MWLLGKREIDENEPGLSKSVLKLSAPPFGVGEQIKGKEEKRNL